jgi:hypothetical protein
MKRLFFSCLVGMLAIGGFDRLAEAEHPEFLRHYHIVPRLSTLGITGGLAGVHERYRLIGEYDLHTGFHHEPIGIHHDTTGGSFASFENAEVWGSIISDHPTIAIVLDVDERLNLEGLKGEQLPVAAPFDVYKFTGQTRDGSDLTLFASLIGHWMYVRGQSSPPEGGSDYFDYQLRMVARSRPFADHNDDGVVNAADYALTRDRMANSLLGSELSDWRSQFGELRPDFSEADAFMSAALGSSATAMPVPEPGSIALVVVCATLLAGARVVRRRTI